MYKTRKKIVLTSVYILSVIFFIFICLALLPTKTVAVLPKVSFTITVLVFLVIIFLCNRIRAWLLAKVRHDTLETGETVILNDFINKLRFCYSLEDFYVTLGDILEKQGDCSVLFVDRSKNYILYNSPNRNATSEYNRTKLDQNFTESWPDGSYFFDRHIGVTTKYKKAPGFFMVFS